MITRTTKLQLFGLLLVAVVGITYTGVRYANLGSILGATSYPVIMRMEQSGGIFTGADVTYRGVSVGRVGPLRLIPDGVAVRLDIDTSAPPIPAAVTAKVRNLSPIGEQYVDLLPSTDSGPMLTGGSVITAENIETPVPVGVFVASVDDLVRSVPLDQLRLVVDQLGVAFAGTGQPLQRLLDTTGEFVDAATAALPQTTALIEDSRTVLGTFKDTSGQFREFSANLALFAAQLKESDGDLRRVIQYAPPAAEELSALLDESGSQLGEVIANLLTVTRIAEPRQPGLRQVLVTYPALVAGVLTAVPGDGTAHLGLVLNVFDPPPCYRGYEGTDKRPGDEVSEVPVNEDARCAEPPGSPTSVRGAQNVPRSDTGGPATADQQWNDRNADKASTEAAAPNPPQLVDTTEIPLSSPAQILEAG
ncbi:MAG: MCE family protein [Pseudonocardia sp.]|nr:MCE family protein [Pseudonocardia sp.]